MKIRTESELQDIIDADFAWRLKELSILKSNVLRSDTISTRGAIRVGIVMLYAHWEGLVKKLCESYLIYVSGKRLLYKELNYSFVAIVIREMFAGLSSSSILVNKKMVEFVLKCGDERSLVPYKGIISTQSNLNSNVLEEMLNVVGIDYSQYELKANLIDSKLLANRNAIAHGEFVRVDADDFYFIYDEMLAMMRNIKDDIINSASLKKYRN
ncbi:MAE_28990/MAE_18760 family HEPN-like nuclease [Hymenobacter sp. UYCo722]|uniref:MAE_28990/MAE_18760 family HEPN-like nuclease n=1 Tax=Hymenobacter sp. UYCo722 TaxID=3156335 RepID=UPI0033974F9E